MMIFNLKDSPAEIDNNNERQLHTDRKTPVSVQRNGMSPPWLLDPLLSSPLPLSRYDNMI